MKNGTPRARAPRALVAGAAGFIGSHLCERLLAEGWHVIGIDNFLTGRPRNVEHLARDPRFELHELDVIEPLGVFRSLDWVFHLASPASPPAYQRHSLRCLQANSEGTRNLLNVAARSGAAFLLASTSEVYGDPLVHPQTESYWGNVNPVGPRSMYDEAKRFAESLTVDFGRVHGVPTRIARIFNTYGPRMAPDDGRVISNFVCQALRGKPLTVYGDGSQTRSFQYVDDLVEALFRLTRVDYPHPINLGNPEEHTIAQLVAVVGDVLGHPVTVEHRALPGDDPRQRRPDTRLARSVLGWAPRVGLREGLRRTAAHFRGVLGVERREPVWSPPPQLVAP